MTIGQRLRQHRQAAGLSLDGLAGKTGVSRAYIWKLEQDQGNPTLRMLEQLAEGLSIHPSVLLGSEPGTVPITLRVAQECYGMPENDVRDLAWISFHGRQPIDPDDWELLWLTLRRVVGVI